MMAARAPFRAVRCMIGDGLRAAHLAEGGSVPQDYVVRPIGFVRSAVRSLEDAPKQGALAGTEAEIVVDPAFAEALAGLALRVGAADGPPDAGREVHRSGKIIVLCWMDRADRGRLTVHPRGQEDKPARGVFS